MDFSIIRSTLNQRMNDAILYNSSNWRFCRQPGCFMQVTASPSAFMACTPVFGQQYQVAILNNHIDGRRNNVYIIRSNFYPILNQVHFHGSALFEQIG